MTFLPLTFRVRQIWLFLVILYVGCILVFQYTTLQRVSGKSDFSSLAEGDLLAYSYKFFRYYFSFDLISVCLLLKILFVYRQWFNLRILKLTPYNLLRYEAAYLPAILLAIPLFGPITNAVRYGVLYAPGWNWANYYPEYFFTWRMFLNYLLPTLLFSYCFININLILDYFDQQLLPSVDLKQPDPAHAHGVKSLTVEPAVNTDKPFTACLETDLPAANVPSPVNTVETVPTAIDSVASSLTVPTESTYLRSVVAFDAAGQRHLAVSTIYFFAVHHKTYRAHATCGLYTIHKTMSELEVELDPHSFYRINRSVIINLHYVKNYSHWEYDKYIVRLTDNKSEFVMQRTHLKMLRERLNRLPR